MLSEQVIDAANGFLEVAPIAIMDDVYNCAHSYLCDGIDALELALKKQISANIDRERITAMVESVHDAIVKRLDKNLDKMELYTLTNILTVSEDLCSDLQALNKCNIGQAGTDFSRNEVDADRERINLLSKIRLARRLNAYLKKELVSFDRERPRLSELMETSERFVKELSSAQDIVMNAGCKVRQHRDAVTNLKQDIGSQFYEEPEFDTLISAQIQLKSLTKFTEYCQSRES